MIVGMIGQYNTEPVPLKMFAVSPVNPFCSSLCHAELNITSVDNSLLVGQTDNGKLMIS